jgi:hypothetical protein
MSASGSFTWMGSMARSALSSLGPVRLLRSLEACALRDLVWVRGGVLEKSDLQLLDTLPWNDRYEIVSGKYLRPFHSLLPTGRLPVCTWVPLATFIQPALATSLLPGRRPALAPLQWIPARTERKPSLLLARGADWLAFADRAPQVRLERLKFAHDANQQSLISGWPLPSLQGTYFYEEEGVALPAGYDLEPKLNRATWQRLLSLKESDLAFVQMDGFYSVIPESAWMKATRSAVRMSLNAPSYV